jgi:RHS repeat-associated protein
VEHEIVKGTMKSLKLPKILPLEYPPRVHARQARSLALSHVASPPLASQYGVNLKYQRHTANNLNQYTSRSVPGYVEVVGTANSQATVTVNGTPTHRRGDYFRAEVAVDNSSGPVWQAITNLAVLNNGTSPDIVTNVVGNTLVAARQETFTHDSDGNLTADSRWSYSWNAGNRLVSMESAAGVPSAAKRRLEFSYDPQGRRIQKVVYTNNGTIYLPALTNRFVYDGWNLVAVLGADNTLLRSFAWGTDLSGTFQGAGGVGGLLWLRDTSTLNNQPSTHFVAHDGNGNVSLLVNAADGTDSARYEYGPFGEVIRATGPMAKANPFRFSTKYQDDETDLLYYGLRYLKTSTGGWLSRDPIAEKGGLNLYSFVGNDSVNRWDVLGKKCCLLTYSPGIGPTHGGISVGGHSALKCDSGAYISFWPAQDGDPSSQWHNEQQDADHYLGQTPSQVCLDCLDESAVAAWLANAQQAGTSWCWGNNCADATGAGIAAGLPSPQIKPKCPCSSDRFTKWKLQDLMQSVNGGIIMPSGTADRMAALAGNNCQRYKCLLIYVLTGLPVYSL